MNYLNYNIPILIFVELSETSDLFCPSIEFACPVLQHNGSTEWKCVTTDFICDYFSIPDCADGRDENITMCGE